MREVETSGMHAWRKRQNGKEELRKIRELFVVGGEPISDLVWTTCTEKLK